MSLTMTLNAARFEILSYESTVNAVLEVVDEMTTAKGLRALGEFERTPIMREFCQRKAA